MALLEDLIADIRDPRLRSRIAAEVGGLKARQKFGLVFEEHIPETTTLYGLQVQTGSTVQRRDDPGTGPLYRVTSVNGRGRAKLEPLDGKGDAVEARVRDVLVVKQFGEPVYPSIKSLGTIRRGSPEKPCHAVINGENFHALQLLLYLYEGKVDCIYIDPPYNTGGQRDWKYNNHYVDGTDAWRHSKWLSMMEKRLRLARRLLKPDGVLIVTIDDNEVHHLGMLLERLFPEYLHYMITMVINPKGREKANFAPVGEYAIFIVPNLERDVIPRAPVGPLTQQTTLDMEPHEDSADEDEIGPTDNDPAEDEPAGQTPVEPKWEWRHARRRGGGAESSSYREKRPHQFYPIYIDETARRVIRVGESIPLEQEPDFKKVGGLRPLWPIDTQGRHRCWSFVPSSMQRMIEQGHVALGKYHPERDDWTVNYRVPMKSTRKLKTVWWEKAHDAGTHGTELLKRLLGEPGLFPFPKSVYAVRDCLAAVVRHRPDALILDFFAGSGTTLHATCLLNAADGGHRRSVLVTNNEVSERVATRLYEEGVFPGDSKFERHGIFEQVTRPRCEAVITGKRPDGTAIPGNHLDGLGTSKGRLFSEGFEENVEFFRLDYLDPQEVDLGSQFDAILPALWLAAGGVGDREEGASSKHFSLPPGSTYAVLFRESRFRSFRDALGRRPEVTHVFLVTDSEEAYAEMRPALPSRVTTSMLYRDYLRNFRINTTR